MYGHNSQDDLWVEFRKRREDWRAQREARRAAWRARREARRAGRCSGDWGHWRSAADWGMDPASWGMGVPSGETEALKAKIAEMEKTIAQLNERVIVLEKLATTTDDARLAAEIEKLRGKDK